MRHTSLVERVKILLLWSRQFRRTWAWLAATLLVVTVTLWLPVSTIEDSKRFYLAAPALLAFALSLTGSYAASVIDDWRNMGWRHGPWIHVLVAASLPVAVFIWHFDVLRALALIPQEALRFHGLARWSFNSISWVIFLAAALLPIGISLLLPASSRLGWSRRPNSPRSLITPAQLGGPGNSQPRQSGAEIQPRKEHKTTIASLIGAGLTGVLIGVTACRITSRRR